MEEKQIQLRKTVYTCEKNIINLWEMYLEKLEDFSFCEILKLELAED